MTQNIQNAVCSTNLFHPALAKKDATLVAMPQRLLSRKEAARYLNLAPQTLAQWASSGRVALPFIKIGARRVAYELSVLEEYVASQKRSYHA